MLKHLRNPREKELVFGKNDGRNSEQKRIERRYPELARALVLMNLTAGEARASKWEAGPQTTLPTCFYLESPGLFKNRSMTPLFRVMTPFLKGHGDSR